MAVKVIIEEGDLKGRLWKVHILPQDGSYPGKETP
jgi:hypothetical protein